ncbi:MAG: hypothetical protein HYZ53_19780 [Planctomycetes bacterium]|nr:hypothetical protein [Planctomycetota bacterium]
MQPNERAQRPAPPGSALPSSPAFLLFAALLLAVGLAAPPSPAAADGPEAAPNEETLAKYKELADKPDPAFELNLVNHLLWAVQSKLYDDVRTLSDRILRWYPQNGTALQAAQDAKGKSSDAAYPDRQAQKKRVELEDQLRARLKEAEDQYVKDCFAVAAWCHKNQYAAGKRLSLRKLLRVRPGHPEAAPELGYVKLEEGQWVHASQRPLLDALGTAVYADDEAKRSRAVEELLARADLDLVELQETIRHCRQFPALKGRGAEEKLEVKVDGEESEFYVRVPTQYAPEKKWAVYITLHPTEGKAYFWVRVFKRVQKVYERYIVAAPTLLTPKSKITWREPKAVHQVDAVLKHLLKNYNVDTNRVFLDGFGIGCGCLLHAQYTPDRYAGIVCRDRVYFMGKEPSRVGIQGLLDLPLYLMLGKNVEDYRTEDADAVTKLLKEHDCPHMYRTIVGVGEDALTSENAHIFEWLEKQAREPFPRRVAMAPDPNAPLPMDRAYWIQLTDFSWKASLEAEYRGNLIEVKTDRVRAFDVLLSDRFMDLDQPVQVLVNGKEKWNGKVVRDVRFLLDHVRATKDRERTYVARIPIEVWKPRTKDDGKGSGERQTDDK